jgi:hypothetical protein
MTHETSFTTLSDQDLIVQVHRLAANERTATATLIACLAELDARRLHLGMGYSSLHDYARRRCISPTTPATRGSKRHESYGDFPWCLTCCGTDRSI